MASYYRFIGTGPTKQSYEFRQRIHIMGTNVAPILANLYVAMLENELQAKCRNDPKLKLPVLFKRRQFIGLPNATSSEKVLKSINGQSGIK